MFSSCLFNMLLPVPEILAKIRETVDLTIHLHSLHVQLVFSSRYAEDVITCFRFTVLFVVAVCSFLMTLCAVIMVMVSKTFKRRPITRSTN